jgi:Holliday junction resolvase
VSLKNAKAKGSRNERRTMALLEAAGYVCTKAGGSLGIFDVIGISTQDTVCVQVKSNAWPGTLEMEALKNFQGHERCRVIVHRWRDRQRMPDVREV